MRGDGTTADGATPTTRASARARSCGRGWVTARLHRELLPFPFAQTICMTFCRIDDRWQGTQNALAGLFCASLGSMDVQRTTSPARAFPPAGDLPLLPRVAMDTAGSPRYHLRHATLPAEHVCTENLTPFLKLLPCPSRAGVAALLEPHHIFDSHWHGLGAHVRWRAGVGVELVLTVQAVFDPVRTSQGGKRGGL